MHKAITREQAREKKRKRDNTDTIPKSNQVKLEGTIMHEEPGKVIAAVKKAKVTKGHCRHLFAIATPPQGATLALETKG